MSTYLGQKGYTIYKDSLDVKEQLLIRKELEVSPWVPKSSFHKPPSFPIYRESKSKIYIPRFYGIGNYATDAYRIFCLGEWQSVKPKDGALVNYHNFLKSTVKDWNSTHKLMKKSFSYYN